MWIATVFGGREGGGNQARRPARRADAAHPDLRARDQRRENWIRPIEGAEQFGRSAIKP